jgi:hypothetical protein
MHELRCIGDMSVERRRSKIRVPAKQPALTRCACHVRLGAKEQFDPNLCSPESACVFS